MVYRLSIDENNEKAVEIIDMLNTLSENSDYLHFEKQQEQPKLSASEIQTLEDRYQESINHPENLTPWNDFKEEILATL